MRVLTFYIDPVAYRDRLLMLRAAAPRVGQIEVLLGQGDAATVAELATPHLAVTPLASTELGRVRREAALWRAVGDRVAQGVELVHDTQGQMGAAFARLRLMRGRPRLLTSTFAAAYEWYEDLRKAYPYESLAYSRLRWRAFWQEKVSCKVADAVTVFGEGHRERLARCHGIPVGRVHSLPNCCDPAIFFPRTAGPELFGFEPGTRVLLTVGNLFAYKGTWELLRAFAAVARKHDDARLVLVGRPHDEQAEALKKEPEVLGVAERVRFIGRAPREELPAMLSAADAFVLPSYTEGSPRVVIEAMACARPVVATRLPGVETLDPEGEFIRLVPRADTAELARALSAHLESSAAERARRGAAARARFLAHHTPEAAAVPLPRAVPHARPCSRCAVALHGLGGDRVLGDPIRRAHRAQTRRLAQQALQHGRESGRDS